MLMVMMVKVTVISTMALSTNLAAGSPGMERGGSVDEAGWVEWWDLISLLTCVVFLIFRFYISIFVLVPHLTSQQCIPKPQRQTRLF